MRKLLFCLATAALIVGCQSNTEDEAATTASNAPATTGEANSASPGMNEVTFASIKPILDDKCIKCHGEQPKEGVDLRSYESLMKGGEHGPIVKEGDPENSVLVQVLRGSHGKKIMPLNTQGLPDEDIQRIEEWIKAGAKA